MRRNFFSPLHFLLFFLAFHFLFNASKIVEMRNR